jgi:hypothetical protein
MVHRVANAVAAIAFVLVGAAAAAAGPAENGPIRFRPLHVYVDPAGMPLAAYQVEIVAGGNATIVGVEGGEHPAFLEPPYYDPAALAGGRIVIAAFDTGSDLPRQRNRVATLNLREVGSVDPTYRATLEIAGNADGEAIDAAVDLVPAEGDAP